MGFDSWKTNIPSGSILGVNYSGAHDSAIALVSPQGEVIFASSLERVSRVKQDGRPPHLLLEGLDWSRIAKVAVSTHERPWSPKETESKIHPSRLEFPRDSIAEHGPQFLDFFASLPVQKEYICHQLSHAHSAFWPSGYEDAMILTYDGGMQNSPWFGGLYSATKSKGIQPVDLFHAGYYAKITSLYSVVTGLLGFTPNKHEGKITGLAAYGTASIECCEALDRLFSSRYFDVESCVEWFFSYSLEQAPALVVNEFKRHSLFESLRGFSREDIAASVQRLAEMHVLKIISSAKEQGLITSKRICLSGGLFANVKINQRVLESGFDDIFISPAMTDDGTAWGAALAVAAREEGFLAKPIRNVFLGYSFEESEVRNTLSQLGIRFEHVEDIVVETASLLAADQVVAVFQGAMEFGPRALGHRSILGQATRPEINAVLNKRLNRTEFMPFAPMTRVEDAASCYPDLKGGFLASEFMTITADCSRAMKKESPAVVHVDGTARPQLIRKESHPFIHGVISSYYERTGFKSIINTSFNIHEEPIVCTPQDAVVGFLESGLDFLVFPESGITVEYKKNLDVALTILKEKQGTRGQARAVLKDVNDELWRRVGVLKSSELEKEMKLEANVRGWADSEKAFRLALSHAEEVIERQNLDIRRLKGAAEGLLVSIVVPTYNQGAYIRACLESIQKQTYTNFEVIIQDACSTDETESICREFANSDSRFVYIREKDSGQSDAINRGLKLSKGYFWTWICSDDFYCNRLAIDQLATRLSLLKDLDPGVVGAYGNAQYVDEDGTYLGPYGNRTFDLFQFDFKLDWPLSQPSSLLIRDRVLKVGGVDSLLNLGMDLDLFLKLLRDRSRLLWVPQMIASIRVQSNSKSVRFRKLTAQTALSIVKKHFGDVGGLSQSAYFREFATARRIESSLRIRSFIFKVIPFSRSMYEKRTELKAKAHVVLNRNYRAKDWSERVFIASWKSYHYIRNNFYWPIKGRILMPFVRRVNRGIDLGIRVVTRWNPKI